MDDKSVWVFEYLSGGGLGRAPRGADEASLLEAGRAMRDALVGDLSRLPGLGVRWVDGGRGAARAAGARVGAGGEAAAGAEARAGAGAGADARGDAGANADSRARAGQADRDRDHNSDRDSDRNSDLRADPTNLRESTFSGPVSGPRRGETVPDFVRRAAARRRWCWVVAPESEGLLAELAEAVAPRDWVGCTHAAIALCSSKRRTLLRLAAHGVATPLAFAREADDAQSRWVVKPDDGAGTVHTQRHATRERAEADLAQRLARGASATLEPWVEGEALSLSLLCGPHGAELLAVNRQHIVADAEGHLCDEGVLVGAVAPHDPRRAALADLSRAVHAAIGGLFGFVGVDLVWHPARGPVAVEVNPRLTCAYVGLSQALGRNLAGEILALHEAKVLHVQH